jgi:hypothetical protein
MAFFDAITIDIFRDDLPSPWEFKGKPDSNSGVSFGLTSVLGLEFPELEVFTQPKGLGDGVFFTGQRFQPRTIEIHAKQLGRTPEDIFHYRRQIMEYFLMNHDYKIVVEVVDQGSWSTKTRCLNNCKLIAASYPTIDAADTNPDIVLQFMAPEAYFEAVTASTKTETNLADRTFMTVSANGDYKVRPIIKMTCTTSAANMAEMTISMPDLGLYTRTITGNYYDTTGSYLTLGDVIILDPEKSSVNINGTDYEVHPGDAAAFFTNCFLIPNESIRFSYLPYDTQGNQISGSKWTVEFEWTERYSGI